MRLILILGKLVADKGMGLCLREWKLVNYGRMGLHGRMHPGTVLTDKLRCLTTGPKKCLQRLRILLKRCRQAAPNLSGVRHVLRNCTEKVGSYKLLQPGQSKCLSGRIVRVRLNRGDISAVAWGFVEGHYCCGPAPCN